MTEEPTDAELAAWAIEQLKLHGRTLLKAPITATFVFIAVASFSGSIWKAATVAVACLIVSAFATWRRFLEPLAFWSCAAAVALWCEPNLATHIRSAAAGL